MKAVIYARYSSDNQSEESIQAQLRACDEYAKRNNITIINTYIDRAQSARSDKRDNFQKMIRDSEKRSFDVVIVHKLDRFSRDRYDHAIYRKKLRDNGIRLISVLENLDDSPESVVLESVLEGFSEYYSKNLARETRKGLKETALKGKFTGGVPPLGYDLDDDKNYIINEIEADAVREIFRSVLEGIGYTPLMNSLNRRGLKTKFGKPFGKTSFHDILKNQKYIGKYIYYPVGTAKEKKSEPIVVEGIIPPIIDEKTFWEVQNIMNSRKNNGRNKAVETFILSGIFVCGECGSAMTGHRQHNGRYYYYECCKSTRTKQCDNRTFNRDKIEKIVCDYIKQLLDQNTIDEIKTFILKHSSVINAENSKLEKSLKTELLAIDRRLNTLADMLIETPSDTLKNKLLNLEERQKQIKIQLEELETAEITEEKLDEYITYISDFENLSRKQKQIFASKLIKKITAYKNGNLEITTTYKDIIDNIGGATPNLLSLIMPYWAFQKYNY